MSPVEVALSEDGPAADQPVPPLALEASGAVRDDDDGIRGNARVPSHADLAAVWRLLRRLGVPDTEVDDATQQVFLVVAERWDVIETGKLRAFVFGTALRVARHTLSRADKRTTSLDEARSVAHDGPTTEELVDRHQARLLLDSILREMSFDLRTVLVLFEFEQLSMSEIARALELPRGTVASRLRRAREEFQQRVTSRTTRPPVQGGSR